MIPTVWTLFRRSLRGSLRRVARGVPRRVMGGGGSNCGVGMTGRQTCLRTVQQKSQEEETGRQDVADLTHVVTYSASPAITLQEREGESLPAICPSLAHQQGQTQSNRTKDDLVQMALSLSA